MSNLAEAKRNSGNATVEVNYCKDENTASHHTNEYENKSLVVRRGGKLKIGMTFKNVPEIPETTLRFNVESKEKELNLFSYVCQPQETFNDDSKWEMVIVEKSKEQLNLVVSINIPVDVIIGRYFVDVIAPSSPKPLKQFEIIVIFNPWNKDDEVFLDDEEMRNEFVLNDTGIIYRGFAIKDPRGIDPLNWEFGQFEENVLDCVLYLLQNGQKARPFLKSISLCRGAVWISRRLSALLNVQDDNGVLVGNWSGNYRGGVPPMAWNSSVNIFDKYFTTKKPVKYGQCWVFSGIMTTALRALGIPARSVTNYQSAHDKDATMTIDNYFDDEGNHLRYMSGDSLWNFHVWNEIWTKRKDLPGDSYDGWQAVDTTPQETSNKLFQMGPAPVKAVKEGEIYAGFDTGFVFGEVNCDYIKWILAKDENGNVHANFSRNMTDYIGKFISTKMVGKDEREDITHLYKYPEGSEEERKAFATAYSFGKGPEKWEGQLNVEEQGHDFTIDLSTKSDANIQRGEDFDFVVSIKNESQQEQTLDVIGVINSMVYNGGAKMLIKKDKIPGVVIKAGQSWTKELHVSAKEYLGKLTDYSSFKLVVVAKIKDTGKMYVDDLTFQLFNKDSIEIKFPEKSLKVGQPSEVTVTFTNPLPINLTNLVFTIEGAGLCKEQKKSFNGPILSGKSKGLSFTITPKKVGKRKLHVDIDSRQIKDFKGFASVEVSQ